MKFLNDSSQFKIYLIPIAMFCVSLFCFPFLPAQIAAHWDASWNPNGWAAKWIIFLLPLVDAFILPFFSAALSNSLNRYFSVPGSGNLCYLLLSLGCFVLNIFIIKDGFYQSVHPVVFITLSATGAILILTALYTGSKKHTSYVLEFLGLTVLALNLLRF